ncbi:MAG: hypothetical protein ACJASL_000608 [Paraglaciecola sp.]|jgi:hypothetical protein
MPSKKNILHVVHCIDTEGPLTEDIGATFERLENIFGISLTPSIESLKALQNCELDLGGIEKDVARVVAPNLIKYNNSWDDIQVMLEDAMSREYRNKILDDKGEGWVFSWHCMDHAGYSDNPRRKDLGFGNVFRFYKQMLQETRSSRDELNWHFHPLSFNRNPLQCASSYVNSYDVLMQILCRRVIEEGWYPLANRPGFHTERPDSHLFLEQWIPFDYANQFFEKDDGQPDLVKGRFGDWRRSSSSWRGYQPSHDDYQVPGNCRRWIFRCLNVGTRFNELQESHVRQAFDEAQESGSAILAFANHDFRDIRPDVDYVRDLIERVRGDFPGVILKFSGAVEAAREHTNLLSESTYPNISISMEIKGSVLSVSIDNGKLFGPQPFLALKTRGGNYYHDNFDVQEPGRSYSYVMDSQTLTLDNLEVIAVGASGIEGSSQVIKKVFE